jgi:hypothetical protein
MEASDIIPEVIQIQPDNTEDEFTEFLKYLTKTIILAFKIPSQD